MSNYQAFKIFCLLDYRRNACGFINL